MSAKGAGFAPYRFALKAAERDLRLAAAGEAPLISKDAHHLLWVRAAHADAAGRCFPRTARLMGLTRISRSQLRRARDELDEARLIDVKTGSGGRSTTYTLLLDSIEGCRLGTGTTVAPVPDRTGTDATVTPLRVPDGTPEVSTGHPELPSNSSCDVSSKELPP